MEHKPVLLQESIEGLAIQPNGCYVDGTFGRGGHASAILERLSDAGCLIAIDKDKEAIDAAAQSSLASDKRFSIHHTSLDHLYDVINAEGMVGKVDGILLDLGVSSPQLDDASRGFSFMREGKLDMRMDQRATETAADFVNHAPESKIMTVLKEYGEERFAKQIAKHIIHARAIAPIETTKQLADLIEKKMPRKRHDQKHPATRTFQAIRIYINRELDELMLCLEQCLKVLKEGGRLAVITFHSLEERIVKNFIKENEQDSRYPADLPIKAAELQPKLKRIGSAIKPALDEIEKNIRARSATLRIMEKLGC